LKNLFSAKIIIEQLEIYSKSQFEKIKKEKLSFTSGMDSDYLGDFEFIIFIKCRNNFIFILNKILVNGDWAQSPIPILGSIKKKLLKYI